MKKIILSAVLGSAALGLAACDNAADDVEENTTVVTEDPAPVPTATETAVVDPDATPTDGSTLSVGPDGVEADIDAGDARVRTDGDGTTTVTTD